MASLQARHRRGCPRGLWTTAKGAKTGCTCGAKLTYVARYWDGGKNRQATLGRDLEEAKRELRDLEEKVDRKRRGFSPSIDRNITFAEWADQWLDGSTIKENTRRSYKPTIEIAKFVLGQRLVRSLDVDDVLAILEATKAPSECPRRPDTFAFSRPACKRRSNQGTRIGTLRGTLPQVIQAEARQGEGELLHQ